MRSGIETMGAGRTGGARS